MCDPIYPSLLSQFSITNLSLQIVNEQNVYSFQDNENKNQNKKIEKFSALLTSKN